MTVIPIGTQSVAISLPATAFESRSHSAIHTLATQALRDADIPLIGEVELDCYKNGAQVLLFARVVPRAWAVYRFSSLENMIGGAQTLASVCTSPSTLFYYEDAYYLAVEQPGPEVGSLSEFGNEEPAPVLRVRTLSEHGTTLCQSHAIEMLAQTFHT